MHSRLIVFNAGTTAPVFKKINIHHKLKQLQAIIKTETISLLPLSTDLMKKGYIFYADDTGLLKKVSTEMNSMVYPLIISEHPGGLKGIAVLVCPKNYNIQDLLHYYSKCPSDMGESAQTLFEKMGQLMMFSYAMDGVNKDKEEKTKQQSQKDQKKNKIRLRYPTKKKRATRICVLEARLHKTRNYTAEISLIQEMDV